MASQDGTVKPVGTLATDELMSVMYDDLRRLAAYRLSTFPTGTLSATALVHEAYLRLSDGECSQQWSSHRHFVCAAAEGMRRILIDDVRRKRSRKRGGHVKREEMDDVSAETSGPPEEDLLALDEALGELKRLDAEAATLVSLRYFTGLTIPEAAETMGISPRTADRIWSYARAWLYDRLRA